MGATESHASGEAVATRHTIPKGESAQEAQALEPWVAHYLQVAIESCINLANHIIAAERYRSSKDYKDTFRVLNEVGILPDGFSRTM